MCQEAYKSDNFLPHSQFKNKNKINFRNNNLKGNLKENAKIGNNPFVGSKCLPLDQNRSQRSRSLEGMEQH